METIRAPVDFLGVNYYDPVYIRRRRGTPGWGEQPIDAFPDAVSVKPEQYPRTSSGWIIDPGSFYELLMAVSRRLQAFRCTLRRTDVLFMTMPTHPAMSTTPNGSSILRNIWLR